MRTLRTATAIVLAFLLMPIHTVQAAESAPSLVDRTVLDGALALRLTQDDSARDAVRGLLAREDVRAIASAYGLDTQRAASAVDTLQGAELQRLAGLSANAEQQLAGGEYVVSMSLVAFLLIVIIVILLAH